MTQRHGPPVAASAGGQPPDAANTGVGAPAGPSTDSRAAAPEASPPTPTPPTPPTEPATPTTLRSPLAPVIWWLWCAFAVANLIDLAVQGRDHGSAEAAAALILVTGVAYVAALRPRVVAGEHHVVVRNPVRDHRVPWLAVSRVDLVDLLRIRCAWREPAGSARSRVIHAWAVQSSRRGRAVAELRAAGRARGGLLRRFDPSDRPAEPIGSIQRKEAQRIAALLDERARQERDRWLGRPGAGQPGDAAEPLTDAAPVTAWHWPSVAAVVVPALLLIAVILL